MNGESRIDKLRDQILKMVEEYARLAHCPEGFIPGKTPVPVSGRVYGESELKNLADSALEFWLTAGHFNKSFEDTLSQFLGIKYVLTVNSGSSANLLALASLTSHFLGDRALRPGDEVITVAAGFPTTVNPILLYGLVPVFLDVHIPTYNIDTTQLEGALSPKTRAVMLGHTLGNPFDLQTVSRFCKENGLWLVEDCCDALGSTYDGKQVGSFGDVGTLSFYPAHHITMGEGGAVFTANSSLKRIIDSLRDWGRDCWCDPGKDNTCKKRFEWKMGNLPEGYDHKYIYSHTGYNLKITDMQAAVGLAQMGRLEEFISIRKKNFRYLNDSFKQFEHIFILPEATPNCDPSWFGFPLTLRSDAPFSRKALIKHLETLKIGTRLLFGGNLTCQPYMMHHNYKTPFELKNTNTVMNQTFWIGVYPGLNEEMLSYIVNGINDFLANI